MASLPGAAQPPHAGSLAEHGSPDVRLTRLYLDHAGVYDLPHTHALPTGKRTA